MKINFSRLIQLCGVFCAFTCLEKAHAANHYETYLESWNADWLATVQGLPPGPNDLPADSYKDVTLNIGFAAFLFTPPAGIPANNANLYGLQFQNVSDVATIIQYVQSHKGKAKISYGGASYALPFYPNYFISQTTAEGGWPNNIEYLAKNVAKTVTFNYGTVNNPLYLDGVDFDIEDPQPTTINGSNYNAKDFAKNLVTFLTKVRELIRPDQVLSVTIPAQGWNQYWEYLAEKANDATIKINGNTIQVVDYFNFMEYDIWVNPEIDAPTQEDRYAKQIAADLLTYTSSPSTAPASNWATGWGINPAKIQIGLMPANDDTGQNMTPLNAAKLASLSTTTDYGKPLYGIMSWDLNRDALTDVNPNTATNPTKLVPPPYTYSQAIREALANPQVTKDLHKFIKLISKRKARFVFTFPSPKPNQYPPLHGAP